LESLGISNLLKNKELCAEIGDAPKKKGNGELALWQDITSFDVD
jgi:hypothetical protein